MDCPMPRLLTPDQVERYGRDGLVFPVPVLSEADARACRHQLEAFEGQNGGALKGAYRFKSHLLFKWLADLVRTPRILDMVEDLIGPDILLWNTNWFIKEPRTPNFVSWHQDNNYWGLDTKNLVSVWIALSPATVETGCMRMVPGSHRWPTLPHVDTFHADNMLTRGQEIEVGVDEAQAVNVALGTGQAALFAYGIAHSSPANRSDDRRIGLVLRYVPP
ncbi:MAG: phytanoyl-CoA dioxygenase family protein, partial [Alphaproteobacteria bacterium]|nr:phytanoyl-CoA dioxygenase family protein [Alphaproteobacteria bacterium]